MSREPPREAHRDAEDEDGAGIESSDRVTPSDGQYPSMSGPILLVHGGAGAMTRDGRPPRAEDPMRQALRAALRRGQAVLLRRGSAVDAVTEAVSELESAEVFNAGRGSVLTSAGTVEMDASIMRGSDRAAGAVACVRRIAHPIEAARVLLEQGRHVLLVGPAADAHAEQAGLEMVAPEDLVTPARRRAFEEGRDLPLDRDGSGTGTVGSVALDTSGHLAAATSTGGISRQAPGRVGDSPILGAGTWADDRSCAVSATGDGERIMRSLLAHRVDAWIRIGGRDLTEACRLALLNTASLGGHAGCIAIDRGGRVALPFHTEGMARGIAVGSSEPVTALFRDESLGIRSADRSSRGSFGPDG